MTEGTGDETAAPDRADDLAHHEHPEEGESVMDENDSETTHSSRTAYMAGVNITDVNGQHWQEHGPVQR